MNFSTSLYIIEFLNNANFLLKIICICGYPVFAILAILYACLSDSEDNFCKIKVQNNIKKIFSKMWILVILSLILTFIPTANSMYLIIGANYLSNPNLPEKVKQVIERKLNNSSLY